MTILQHSIAQAAAAGGYQIARSLRFNSADTAYLNRTPGTAGNRRTWTWSGWIKLGIASDSNYRSIMEAYTGTSSVYCTLAYESGLLKVNQDNGSGGVMLASAPAILRDPSAWYHVLFAVDTTQATSTNRIKIWINGVQQTLTFSVTPTQNLDTYINAANAHRIGARWNGPSTSSNFDGYMADVRLIDGQQLDPTSFGEFDANTGVWMPKTYSGTYGTNGFWLKFDDNSGTTSTTLGKDSSGNSNNWTPNNFSVTAGIGNDSLVDSPTNYGTDTGAGGEVRGNYATLNSLDKGALDTTNGNLDFVRTSATTDWEHSRGTIQIPSTGKWYWEVTFNGGSTDGIVTGVCPSTFSLSADFGAGSYANVYAWTSLRNLTVNNSTTGSYGTTPSAGDVIMCAFDRDNSKIYFGLNGTWFNSSNPATQTNPAASSIPTEMFPFCGSRSTGSGSLNHGQRAFAYAAPSGFKALCTQNLPTPAIGATSSTLASKNMNIALYTGNGSTLAVTGLGFAPDLVWAKSRSTAGKSHVLYDRVRGNKSLFSDNTAAEITGYLASLDSDGFTASVTPNDTANTNGTTYVGWAWKANGSGSSNTAGSITGTVSANPSAGISIVNWTSNALGQIDTIGHGLGVTPAFVIIKNRDYADWWLTWHKSFSDPVRNYLQLNTTGAVATAGADYWGHTSTAIGVRQSAMATANTQKCIAYVFAEVAGFSKFGSYVGNGSADGTFVYCGFRPRWVLIRNTGGGAWELYDTARDTYNQASLILEPNSSGAEQTAAGYVLDILSNGFKLRGTASGLNASSNTYIFAAFAEAPFQYSRAR